MGVTAQITRDWRIRFFVWMVNLALYVVEVFHKGVGEGKNLINGIGPGCHGTTTIRIRPLQQLSYLTLL